MTIANRAAIAILAWHGFLLFSLFSLAYGEDTEVGVRRTRDGYVVRYTSSKAVYAERLRGGRWIGCGWSADARTDVENMWADDAFELRMKQQPTPSKAPGSLLSTGWKWVDYVQVPGSKPGSVLATVRLSNKSFPVDVGIYTLLDGTSVLTRWLDITNTSKQPLALTTCIPWCGRLWSGEGLVTLVQVSHISRAYF